MLYTTWFVCAKELLAESERAVSATVARTLILSKCVYRPILSVENIAKAPYL